jgi:hypothetical protein
MFEPKVPAVCGAIGFVLSFLIGLFSGAAFFIVLLRAVIMAVMFAGLALGGRFLLQRFLPELLSPTDGADNEVDDSGNVVNITIGENEKDGMSFSESAGQDQSVPDFLQGARQASDSEPGIPDRQVQESSLDAEGVGSRALDVPIGGDMKESGGISSAKPHFGNETAGGLDVLPDLDDFLPDVKNGGEDAMPPEDLISGNSDGTARFDAADLGGAAVESETMAKAIRTILSRDS